MLVFDQLKKNDPQLRLLTAGVLFGLCVLVAGLWWVQIVSGKDYQQHLETQAFRTVRIPAVRGKILDRNGQTIADNAPSYSVSLYLDDLRDDFKTEYFRIRPVKLTTNSAPFWKFWDHSRSVKPVPAHLSSDQIEDLNWLARYHVVSNVVTKVGAQLQKPLSLDFKDFSQHYIKNRAMPYPILEGIDANLVARFEEQNTNPTNGVDLEIQSSRYYPLHTTAVHVLGHLQLDPSSAEGEESFFDYRLPDYRGTVGIEYSLDSFLRGHAGGKSVMVNNQGYRQSESVWEPAVPGSNVVLTLDLTIQQAAEAALRTNGPYKEKTMGAVVVMDVNSGDVLAMASSPTYDPNYYVDRKSFPPGYYSNVVEMDGAEQNRATYGNYRPGSIFKPIVALACLDNGLNPKATYEVQADPEKPTAGCIYLGRRKIKDTAPPGTYDFRRALIHSSNSYFIYNGLRVGVDKIVTLGQQFHFGESLELKTRQVSAGTFPDRKKLDSGWNDGDTANLCIGQGYIDVTPLQMCVVASALANGGKVLWPRLIDHIAPQDPLSDGKSVYYEKGRVRNTIGVKASSIRMLHEAMLDDTENVEGTAYPAFRGSPLNTELRVCGKTGTAQNEVNGGITHTTWFLSFAPYEHPRYAVVVMVENGSSGGGTCVPIARSVYEAILKKEQSAPPSRTMAGNLK